MTLATVGEAARLTRNASCACGSGQRFKDCHGRLALLRGMSDAEFARTMFASIDAHRAGRFDDARAGYERVLAHRPDTPDALNLLGVIDLAQGDLPTALRRLRRATVLFEGTHPDAIHNLAGALVARLVRDETERTEPLWIEARAEPATPRESPVAHARISVVVPSHNHAAYIEAALFSVLTQDRPPDEIIVVDDGSSDDSVGRIRAMAQRHPGRIRLVARESRGAAATINDAIASSHGDWINILNSDDRFAPQRLGRMSSAVAHQRDGWGFSRCRFIDEAALALEGSEQFDVDAHRALIDGVGASDTVGFAFLSGNPAISTGALFFARSLFDRLGGFRDLRYNHDWDFCLRATRHAEPVFVPELLYEYRVHGNNTIHEAYERRRCEADRMLADFYRDVLASGPPANRFAPSPHAWGRLFLVRAIERGHARLLPSGTIERLVDELLAEAGDDER